jgi:hypothetical protein
VVGIGLLIWLELRSAASSAAIYTGSASAGASASSAAFGTASFLPEGVRRSPDVVWGEGTYRMAMMATLLLCWSLCRTALSRRFAVLFPLALFAFFYNPYLSGLISSNVTGKDAYWRIAWLVPLPVLTALCFGSLLPATARFRARPLSVAAALLLLAGYFAFVPARAAFSEKNHVRMGLPGLKVPEKYFEAVRLVTAHVPAGGYVLAPKWVSIYLPTVRHHAHPLMIRPSQYSGPSDQFKERARLVGTVSHKSRDLDRDWFTGALKRYDVSGVVLDRGALRTRGMTRALRASGYRRVGATRSYQVWAR